ncbi:DUF6134 family protein [Spirosoma rhododendri]|uniref:DUF6134 family protein n=1 Tax=Spirosoma rhododendri TaxID=2728024 RepID=UPI0020C3D0AD|nr:DUF6134 family protein [Spirosoma rhododendri]
MSQFRLPALLTACLFIICLSATAQRVSPDADQTQQYAIEVAGIRVGTMTTTRQAQSNQRVQYTLVSDVKANLLLYKVTIYYKVTNLFERGKLVRSIADVQTNRGNFLTQTLWTGEHYAIDAEQYKWSYKTADPKPITYAITNLFFSEPVGMSSAFAEYFGDYASLSPNGNHTYLARRDGRVNTSTKTGSWYGLSRRTRSRTSLFAESDRAGYRLTSRG